MSEGDLQLGYDSELDLLDELEIKHQALKSGGKSWISRLLIGVCGVCRLVSWHSIFRIELYCIRNKWGLISTMAMVISSAILAVSVSKPQLSLSTIDASDYIFTDCIIDQLAASCPAFDHAFYAYFHYESVIIHPYGNQTYASFSYSQCQTVAIPTFPANYRRHCNLFSAGIGTKVTLFFGLYCVITSALQLIVLLCGFCQWSIWHKLIWIYAMLGAVCFAVSLAIWLLLAHIDIILAEHEHSEAFGDAHLSVYPGWLSVIIFLCFLTQCVATLFAFWHIKQLQLPQLKYMIDDFELLENDDLAIEYDEIDDYTHADLGHLMYQPD